jgi:hypothetical protein
MKIPLPQPDWQCMHCTVKRRSLSSYEQAEYELSIMLQNNISKIMVLINESVKLFISNNIVFLLLH